MYIIGYTTQGFGNKVLMLASYIHQFFVLKHSKEIDLTMLYVLNVKSKHEEGTEKEMLTHIFPKLENLKWLTFVNSWKEYDALKKDAYAELTHTYEFDTTALDNYKKYFTINPEYKPLLKKYDTKNGILLHYRLGDKLKLMNEHLVLKHEYFLNNLAKLPTGPVYLVSDSPELASKLLPDAILIREDWVDTFYLMTKFKKMILSESTIGIVATYLNTTKPHVILPEFHVATTSGKLVKKNWGSIFEYETNRKYRAITKTDL